MIADLVYEITATSGTGNFVLAGARSADFRRFIAAHSIGEKVWYGCRGGGQFEFGEGTLIDANTLERTTVHASSAGYGVKVNFAAGNKDLYECPHSGSLLDVGSLSASSSLADNDKLLVIKADGSLQTILGSIVKASGTGTPADTNAPTLSSASGTATGTTTANGSVTTNEANGTLYYLFSTASSATATAVKAGSTQPVTATGAQSVSATGLTASTVYYVHFLHRDTSGNDSAVLSSAQFTTSAVADTTAPTLSSPTGTQTGSTTASGSVSTNEANGTLYRYASTNASETAATVKGANLTQAVTATGVQNTTFSGLTAATQYYAHYVHRDTSGNDSAVSSSAAFTTAAADTTAPTLSSPTGTKTGDTTASGTVSTNEANGTLYYLFSTSSTATATAVKAGQSKAVTAIGAQSVTATGLTAATTYYVHYLQRDAAGNDSAVATSASFVTDAASAMADTYILKADGTKTSQFPASQNFEAKDGNGDSYRSLNPWINIRKADGTPVGAANAKYVIGRAGQPCPISTFSEGLLAGDNGNAVSHGNGVATLARLGSWTDADTAHANYGTYQTGSSFYAWFGNNLASGTVITCVVWVVFSDNSMKQVDNGTGTPLQFTLTVP